MRRNIRIAMVNTASTIGGAAKIAQKLADSVSKNILDIDCELFHAENSTGNPKSAHTHSLYLKYYNVFLARILGSATVMDTGITNHLTNSASDWDVLHIHNLHGYYLNYQRLLSCFAQKPIVWTWHDMWGATGRCAFSFKCDRWVDGCYKCPNKSYYPAAWIDHAHKEFEEKQNLFNSLKNLTIVAPSDWLAEIAIQRGFKTNQIKVIPNPIDLDNFKYIPTSEAKSKLDLDQNKKYILFVAADCSDKRKGYKDFEQLICTLGLNGIAIGKVPESTYKKIKYTGEISNPQRLAEYYSAADALIVPSKADNFPTTILEAIACGTPVFAYATGGIPSQIPTFWDGLVTHNDLDMLITKVASHINDDGKNITLQNKLASHASKQWSCDKIAKQYADIYYRLTEGI